MTFKQYLTRAFFITGICALLLLPLFLVSCSRQPPVTDPVPASTPTTQPPPLIAEESVPSVIMVATVPVKAELLTFNKSRVPMRGRLSLYLEITQGPENRTVDIRGFNLVFFDVPQRIISNKDGGKEQGTLGIEMSGSAQMQYDEEHKLLKADSIPVNAHFPQLDDIFNPENLPAAVQEGNIDTNDEKDFILPSFQLGTIVSFEIELSLTLAQIVEQALSDGQKHIVPATLISTNILIKSLEKNQSEVPGYQITVENTALLFEVASLVRYKLVKKLCLRPVSISESPLDPDPTGRGFDSGLPGAETQWGKGDVVFDVRGWKTIIKPGYKKPPTRQAESEILDLVDEGDCVEVFLVHSFMEIGLYGGGYAQGGAGTAGVKVIVADAGCNRSNPLLLAHELGHTLGLDHPIGGFRTLMCPSGCALRNSSINTRENIQNIRNLLITFELFERVLAPAIEPEECGRRPLECGRCR